MGRNVEILAPAGDFDTLRTAVNAGADAVYAGGERFGARAYAKNFTGEELLAAIDYMHVHGRKLYLTVNTLVKEREFAELYGYLLPFYRQGLDAVIVQDAGVLDFVREEFPGLAIHASTQMTVTHAISAGYLESMGAVRVVPARELSLAEIRRIRRETGLEIECFVHGALCYCYSGQCLLSSMIGGRSGNRGQCAQPCRLPYQTEGKRPSDLLSLKDLNTIGMIPELIEAGIDSFKIEGRMKQPGYVAVVTELYRKYADLYLERGKEGFQVATSDLRRLESAYLRRGYCDGYYHRHNGREMLSLRRPEREDAGEVSLPEARREKINGILMLSPGEHAILEVTCRGIRARAVGAVAEPARKQPADRERLERQLKKTGNTPFVFENLEIRLDGDVFLPVQAVNELRRQGLASLEERLTKGFRRPVLENDDGISPAGNPGDPSGVSEKETGEQRTCMLTASVETKAQLAAAALHPSVSRIYVEDALWAEPGCREEVRRMLAAARESGKEVFFAMARIFRREAEAFYERELETLMKEFDGALARNPEELLYLKRRAESFTAAADMTLWQWNRRAARWWERLGCAFLTAPPELNRWELRELNIRGQELIVYGCLPVMVSAGCVRKNTSGCERKSRTTVLTDRQKRRMTVKNECLYCYNVIYNSLPLMLADQAEEIRALSPGSLRLQFTTEDGRKTQEILDLYAEIFTEGKNRTLPDMEFTRGHWKRGVK